MKLRAFRDRHAGKDVPIPGRVVKVLVAAGDRVEAGQVVVTIEAMKTENALRAEGTGRVRGSWSRQATA